MMRSRKPIARIGIPLSAALILVSVLAGCSSETNLRERPAEPVISPSPSATQPLPEEGQQKIVEDVAPGIPAPSNPAILSETPAAMPRQDEVDEATFFAQGLASTFMYSPGIFAPKPKGETLSVADLRFAPGLSAFAADRYYTWVRDEKTYKRNADNVAGLIFVTPQNVGERGYAIPAVANQKYTSVEVKEGPTSSLDGAPTIEVSFVLSGDLMWVDGQGIFWIAPLKRDISYSVTKQNEEWVLDNWVPSEVQIGDARKATESEVVGVRFSSLSAEDVWDTPPGVPSGVPGEPIEAPRR